MQSFTIGLTILIYKIFVLKVSDVRSMALQRVDREVDDRVIRIQYSSTSNDYEPLEVNIDTSTFSSDIPDKAESCTDERPNEICYRWGTHTNFRSSRMVEDDKCHRVQYTTAMKVPLKVTFNISGCHLYGGGEQSIQLWPIEKSSYKDYSFVSKEADNQSVLESYWLNSKGSYVYVNRTVPLFISLNNKEHTFSIIADDKGPYIRKDYTVTMLYTVCTLDNVKLAHQHAVQKFLGKPSSLPDTRMVSELVWSTWVKYKADINTKKINEFVDDIVANGFRGGQIEIDDKWQTCYGSLKVDSKKFPDMKALIDGVRKRGFCVTLWVHPFINLDCEPYHSEAERLGYLVTSKERRIETVWWNGNASYIDFTNPDAANWYANRLKELQQETGIDSYKFDSGESSYSPQLPVFNRMESDHPETIMKDYIKTAAKFGGLVQVRSGRGTQTYPIYLRMIDRKTNWSFDRGIASLVTTTLLFNILGYPFVMSDMVGGNVYGNETVDDDMFIRWLQASIFIPCLQLSLPPWDVSENALQLTKKFMDLRNRYTDKIILAMKTAVEKGTPVNPPVWWIDPTDPEALAIDSEFLLGEDVLVAPVLTPHAQGRDIYLPSGKWRDENKEGHPIIEGRTWLRNYPADLNTLPHFTKVGSLSKGIVSFPTIIILYLPCALIINQLIGL